MLALSDGSDCASIGAITRQHLEVINLKLADLLALRREVKAIIITCEGDAVADYRIIEALAPALA